MLKSQMFQRIRIDLYQATLSQTDIKHTLIILGTDNCSMNKLNSVRLWAA